MNQHWTISLIAIPDILAAKTGKVAWLRRASPRSQSSEPPRRSIRAECGACSADLKMNFNDMRLIKSLPPSSPATSTNDFPRRICRTGHLDFPDGTFAVCIKTDKRPKRSHFEDRKSLRTRCCRSFCFLMFVSEPKPRLSLFMKRFRHEKETSRHFNVNGTMMSPPKVNCELLVPAPNGVVPFNDAS